jgi:hypothetical protein
MQHDWDILYSILLGGKKKKRKGCTWDRVMHGLMESGAARVKREPTVSENIVAMAIGKHWSVYVTLSFVHTPAL